jgi:predicted RNase H-like HicB family nuclease
MKNAQLSIIIQKDKNGMFIGQIEEFPEVISQGNTIEELKENLLDALKLLLDYQRTTLLKSYSGEKILKRKLQFA